MALMAFGVGLGNESWLCYFYYLLAIMRNDIDDKMRHSIKKSEERMVISPIPWNCPAPWS
jgi:hypothetical protein